jgi:hypothetical protein
MADEREFADFVAQIHNEVLAKAMGDPEDGDTFQEDAFTSVVLEHLEEEEGLEDPSVCQFTDGRTKGSAKINGYSISSTREDVTLFITIYLQGETPEDIASSEVRKNFDRLRRLFEQAVAGRYRDRDHGHEDYDMLQKLHDVRDSVRDVRLVLLTNGLVGEFKGATNKSSGITFSQHVWDIRRMYRCFGAGAPRADIVVNLERHACGPLPCLPMPQRVEEYESYLAIFPGYVLAELYALHSERLLERNVRSFLEARGKVNKGIRDTILNKADHFFAYNNGISVVADEIVMMAGRDGGLAIREIRGMQIVNGGQTTASLYRARTRDDSGLAGIYVQAKISKVRGTSAEHIVHQISKCANSQNAVNEADFHANDPFHIQLEKLSRTVWDPAQSSQWFYERARGQYQVLRLLQVGPKATKTKVRAFETRFPTRQRFDKAKLGQYVNAWDQYPHLVCTGGQKNFVKFMERVKAQDTDPITSEDEFKRLVAKIILFRDVERIIREVKEIQGYRSQLAAYIVALVSSGTAKRLDFNAVWKSQSIPAWLRALVFKLAKPVHDRIVESAQGRNVTEWCKKIECWRVIEADFKQSFSQRK